MTHHAAINNMSKQVGVSVWDEGLKVGYFVDWGFSTQLPFVL